MLRTAHSSTNTGLAGLTNLWIGLCVLAFLLCPCICTGIGHFSFCSLHSFFVIPFRLSLCNNFLCVQLQQKPKKKESGGKNKKKNRVTTSCSSLSLFLPENWLDDARQRAIVCKRTGAIERHGRTYWCDVHECSVKVRVHFMMCAGATWEIRKWLVWNGIGDRGQFEQHCNRWSELSMGMRVRDGGLVFRQQVCHVECNVPNESNATTGSNWYDVWEQWETCAFFFPRRKRTFFFFFSLHFPEIYPYHLEA